MSRIKSVFFGLLCSYSLAACGAGDTGSGDAARLARACEAKMADWSAEMCQCLSEVATERLSPRGIELNTAIMEDDEAKAQELRGQMPIDELMPAGMLMANAPAECQRRLNQ